MLTLKSVHSYYGHLHVLKGISLHVRQGEVVTLIGANGAGKSTTLRTITGLVRPRQGNITFLDREISRTPTDHLVGLGLAHVPEGRRVFNSLSVAANLEMGAFSRRDREVKSDIAAFQERFPVLGERAEQAAGTLSGGEQQLLAICRALMSRPRLLLLDEPSMGLSPLNIRLVYDVIAALKARGATILLIEQNARAALKVADRGYVMETGRIILDGTADELLDHQEVKRAYLGKGYQEVWE